MNISEQEFLTTAEVAAWLRMPESSVRWWRHSGKGPASFSVGKRVLYRRTVVEAWIAEQEREAS